MKPVYGQNLVDGLRKRSDKITQRLWIAVPYVGGLKAVRRILGRNWIENPAISIRLLADTTEFNNFNSQTIRLFQQRGEIKHLAGLHAKLFITDDSCLLTSANLTNCAFTQRYEIGMFLQGQLARDTIKVFEAWWKKAERVSVENLNALIKNKKVTGEEDYKNELQSLWVLPKDPGQPSENYEKKFLNYSSLLEDYKDFAKKYKSVQRIWKSHPLFFEVDCFLDYLFRNAEGKPSNPYKKSEPRGLTKAQQLSEIEKYIKLFNRDVKRDEIKRYIDSSAIVRNYLNPGAVNTLTKEEVRLVLDQLNGLSSYPWNKDTILESNSLTEIRNALNTLVNGEQLPEVRMTVCNKLKGIGSSSMNEILGFMYPDKYPLINKNSNSGLRFFGYPVKVYQ